MWLGYVIKYKACCRGIARIVLGSGYATPREGWGTVAMCGSCKARKNRALQHQRFKHQSTAKQRDSALVNDELQLVVSVV